MYYIVCELNPTKAVWSFYSSIYISAARVITWILKSLKMCITRGGKRPKTILYKVCNQNYFITPLHDLNRKIFFPSLESKNLLYLVVILLIFNFSFFSSWRNVGFWQSSFYIDLTRPWRLALLAQWVKCVPKLTTFPRLYIG